MTCTEPGYIRVYHRDKHGNTRINDVLTDDPMYARTTVIASLNRAREVWKSAVLAVIPRIAHDA